MCDGIGAHLHENLSLLKSTFLLLICGQAPVQFETCNLALRAAPFCLRTNFFKGDSTMENFTHNFVKLTKFGPFNSAPCVSV